MINWHTHVVYQHSIPRIGEEFTKPSKEQKTILQKELQHLRALLYRDLALIQVLYPDLFPMWLKKACGIGGVHSMKTLIERYLLEDDERPFTLPCPSRDLDPSSAFLRICHRLGPYEVDRFHEIQEAIRHRTVRSLIDEPWVRGNDPASTQSVLLSYIVIAGSILLAFFFLLVIPVPQLLDLDPALILDPHQVDIIKETASNSGCPEIHPAVKERIANLYSFAGAWE